MLNHKANLLKKYDDILMRVAQTEPTTLPPHSTDQGSKCAND
ncbi:hypothetical protein [Acinetobacter sp. C26G]|nr:hypothetical protein [Acinetobacter sp. C26G]